MMRARTKIFERAIYLKVVDRFIEGREFLVGNRSDREAVPIPVTKLVDPLSSLKIKENVQWRKS